MLSPVFQRCSPTLRLRRLLYLPRAEQRPSAVTADGKGSRSPNLRDDGQYTESSFAGPEAVLAYLSRCTHRVAISNSRLIAADESGVTFKYKDYRIEGPERYKTMTVEAHEFIRRLLMHVPKSFHRIRYYGLLANGGHAEHIAKARELLAAAPAKDPEKPNGAKPDQPRVLSP